MKFDYKARPSDVLYRFDVTTTIDGVVREAGSDRDVSRASQCRMGGKSR